MKTNRKPYSQVEVIFRVLLVVLHLPEILSFLVFLFRPSLLFLPVPEKRLDFVIITFLLTRTRLVSPSAFTTAVDPGGPVVIACMKHVKAYSMCDTHQSVRWVLVRPFLLSCLPDQVSLWVQVFLVNPFLPFHLLVLVFRVDLVVLLPTRRCWNQRTGLPDHIVLAVDSRFINTHSLKTGTYIEFRAHH